MQPHDQIRQASFAQLIDWWSEEVPESIERKVRFRISVRDALIAREGGIEFLKAQLGSDDLEKRCRALRDLRGTAGSDPDVMEHVLEWINGDEPVSRVSALSFLRSIAHYCLSPDAVELVFLQTDILDGDLAAEAMLYLAEACPDRAVRILGAGLRSANKGIRGRACDGVWEN